MKQGHMFSYHLTSCIVAIVLMTIPSAGGEEFAKNPCAISIDSRHTNAENLNLSRKHQNRRKMRAVDLTDFSIDQCDTADQVSIFLENNTTTFTLRKVEQIRKRSDDERVKGRVSANKSVFLYGEDENSGSTINILQTSDRRVVASINNVVDGTITQIGYDADGNAVADVKSVSDFPPEEDSPLPLANQSQRKLHKHRSEKLKIPFHKKNKDEIDSNIRRTNAGDDGSQLDIMVLWTKKAECQLSGRPDGCSVSSITTSRMNDLIDLAIAETNTAYSLSGVDTALNLVHSYRSDSYVEEDSSDDPFRAALNAVTNRNDGLLVEVHSLREYYGADLVAMIIDDPLYCGVAWTGPDKDYMFSVTAWNCATGYYSFGHEIGKCNMIGTCIIVTRPHSNLHYPKINSLPLYKCISNSTNYRPGCF